MLGAAAMQVVRARGIQSLESRDNASSTAPSNAAPSAHVGTRSRPAQGPHGFGHWNVNPGPCCVTHLRVFWPCGVSCPARQGSRQAQYPSSARQRYENLTQVEWFLILVVADRPQVLAGRLCIDVSY